MARDGIVHQRAAAFVFNNHSLAQRGLQGGLEKYGLPGQQSRLAGETATSLMGPRVGQAVVDWAIAPRAKLAIKPKTRTRLRFLKVSVL